jgi:hypothetical protein
MRGIKTETEMVLSVSKLRAPGFFLATTLVFLLATPATSAFSLDTSQTVLVTGSVKSVDGSPVPGIKLTFSEPFRPGTPGSIRQDSRFTTNIKTSSSGRFALKLPLGTFETSLRDGSLFSKNSRCLGADFTYSVTSTGQTLEVVVPNKENYKVSFVRAGSNQTVPGVSAEFGKINYVQIPNAPIGNPSFFCSRLWLPSPLSGAFEWFGYEVADEGVPNGSYSYRDPLGQLVKQTIAPNALAESELRISIPEVPTIRVLKETVKFANNTFSGEAVFSELESLEGVDLDRKFNVALAWTAKWWRLEVGRKEFSLTKGNRIRFSYKVVNLYGAEPRLTILGDGFVTSSNFVTVKTQR